MISEAVRGEGAILLDGHGKFVTAGVHPRGDLAPRDVVLRAIATRTRAPGTDHVFLDARAISGFAQRFPTITTYCRDAGIDPCADLIPVAPAAHYQCGGVATDRHGRTSVAGLYAAGEVARTGLHGANRLASNSLLEGLVVGKRAGAAAVERRGAGTPIAEVTLTALPRANRALVQPMMSRHAGVLRTGDGLRVALDRISRSHSATPAPISSPDTALMIGELEDHALTLTARALLIAAAARTESRGCHTRSDFQRGFILRDLPASSIAAHPEHMCL